MTREVPDCRETEEGGMLTTGVPDGEAGILEGALVRGDGGVGG